MAEPVIWQPLSAWAPLATPGRGGAVRPEPGIRIEPIAVTSVLSIVARAGRREDLARIVADLLGATLPGSGRLSETNGCEIVWSGPDHWLVISQEPMSAAFCKAVEEAASVTDQSSARALLQVSGPDALDALAKGFAIDLHPTIFTPGSTAVTSVAHISVQIWQREAARYTIAAPRSFAASFWAWLLGASSAYGYTIGA